PVGLSNAYRRQCSSVQKYAESSAAQARHSTPPVPHRGCSSATDGASGRGRSSPSNGNVSHSSTGGIRSASWTRAQSCSGLSGTKLRLVGALALLVAPQRLGRVDVAERRVRR